MGLFDSLRKTIQDLADQLGTRERQQEALKREREDMQCAPTCRADVKAIIGRYIDSCGARYEAGLQRQVQTMLQRKPEHFVDMNSHIASNLAVLAVPPGTGSQPDAKSIDVALMALLGQQLKPAVFAVIDSMPWGPAAEGLPMEERVRKLAELDHRIDKLGAEIVELQQIAAGNRINH